MTLTVQDPAPAAKAVTLATTNLSKQFGATHALRGVDFAAGKGSVHALLGRNGSGKSTFIKVVAGFYQADEGSVAVHAEALPAHHSPRDAHAAGLRFVHQDLGLVGYLSVAENLALDVPYVTDRSGTIHWRKQHAKAEVELAKLALDIDPRRRVDSLGPVGQTLVAVTRALQGIEYDKSVLFLDEPTARLPRSEVERLLDILGRLKRHGVTVVYVTHRLDEVFAAADDVTVLRDGMLVFAGSVAETSEAEVGRLIVGRVAAPTTRVVSRREQRADAPPAVEARNISGRRVRDVTFRIYPGDVVAVTGLIGSGRSELGRLIFGIEPITSGELLIGGRAVTKLSPRRCTAMGVGYTPQERGDGLAVGLSVAENLAVTSYHGLLHALGISRRRIRGMARRVIDNLSIAPPDPDAVVSTLSGGNQQKVTLGKWTRQRLRLLVLDEPLQGIDVGAKAEVMQAIHARAAEEGLAVLWLESDIEEVVKWADSAFVMKDGRIHGFVGSDELSRETLLAAVYSGAGTTGA